MSENFQDADRFGCEGCPGNPENREYLQQRGVSVSGVDGRPKSNPVLEAIDDAVQPENVGITTEQHNEMLDDIHAVYLQSRPQGPEVAGITTNYYVCRNCGEPIDMTGSGLEGLSAPGDGGEFERVLKKHGAYFSLYGVAFLFDKLRNAHNADRAADKQRIAELEAEINALRAQIPPTVRPFWCFETDRWRCPKDHNPLNRTYDKHCSTCGARLDWSDEGGAK